MSISLANMLWQDRLFNYSNNRKFLFRIQFLEFYLKLPYYSSVNGYEHNYNHNEGGNYTLQIIFSQRGKNEHNLFSIYTKGLEKPFFFPYIQLFPMWRGIKVISADS